MSAVNNEKTLRGDANTARAGFSRVEPKIFAPPQTPSRRGAGWPKFNQLEMIVIGHYLYLQTQFDDLCTQFRVIVVTDPPTHPPTNTPTDRTDNNTLRRS